MKLLLCFLLLISSNSFAFSVQSKAVVVMKNDTVIFSKNPTIVLPLASLTKLMTAVVILDNNLDVNESIQITSDDVDYLKHSTSRVSVNAVLPRFHLLYLALMSSDNRAASALARTFPGGKERFYSLMNAQADLYNMNQTTFVDSSGLNPKNVSTAMDMAKLAKMAKEFEFIQTITSTPFSFFDVGMLDKFTQFRNTNKRVGMKTNILLSKTGHIKEVGFNITVVYKKGDDEYTVVIMGASSRKIRNKDLRKLEKQYGV